MDENIDLTENETIHYFAEFLIKNGWEINSKVLDRNHGIDLIASREDQVLLVEAKGARGNPKDCNVVRTKFDSGQIKDHLGKAIIKVLELKSDFKVHPKIARFLILQPDTAAIRKISTKVFADLLKIDIEFAYIKKNLDCEWLSKANLLQQGKVDD